MWFKDGAMLPGQTNSCLELTNLVSADAGLYCLKVTNACSMVSNCVTLLITNTSDNIPPTIVCTSNQTYQCFALVPPPNPLGVIAMDNSGFVTVMLVDATYLTNGCEILVIYRYKATDPCGNMAFCSQTNFVRDTIPPVLVGVPPNANYQCMSNVPPLPAVTAMEIGRAHV